MITIKDEDEHYCLLNHEGLWTVAERRAGKYHPLGECSRPGFALDQPEAIALFRKDRCYPEQVARRILSEVAGEWRHLYEHLR